jgi:hypothetical protein
MMIEILILRLVHIVSGALWVGAAVFSGVFLSPVLARMGPAAGPVMAGLQARRMFVFLPVIALLTIISGLRLIWIMSGGFTPDYFRTAGGAGYASAGALAILTFVLGITVSRPLGERMGALAGEIARTTDEATKAALARELAALQRRMGAVGGVITVMLVASAAGMAVARYL